MTVLLLSTLPNMVADMLCRHANVEVIDCCDYRTIEARLRSSVERHIPDMLITYRCPYIIPNDIFTLPPLGAYNIHPSLLPKYKGVNPWEAIFANKEPITGVSIHRLTDQIDSGEVVLQQAFPIDYNLTTKAIRNQSDSLAASLLLQLLNTI